MGASTGPTTKDLDGMELDFKDISTLMRPTRLLSSVSRAQPSRFGMEKIPRPMIKKTTTSSLVAVVVSKEMRFTGQFATVPWEHILAT